MFTIPTYIISHNKDTNKISVENADFTNKRSLLNSPRSLEACSRLGIDPSELYKLTLDEFKTMNPDVKSLPQDLIQYRYDAEEKFRNETIKEERLSAEEYIDFLKFTSFNELTKFFQWTEDVNIIDFNTYMSFVKDRNYPLKFWSSDKTYRWFLEDYLKKEPLTLACERSKKYLDSNGEETFWNWFVVQTFILNNH